MTSSAPREGARVGTAKEEETWSEVSTITSRMSNPSQLEQVESIDKILEKAQLTPSDLAHIRKVLYGRLPNDLELADETRALAEQCDFEVRAYQYPVAARQMSPPRIVRIGLIQNKVGAPLTAPYLEQWQAIIDILEPMVDAAGAQSVNV
jgi:beta-ureidopropionase